MLQNLSDHFLSFPFPFFLFPPTSIASAAPPPPPTATPPHQPDHPTANTSALRHDRAPCSMDKQDTAPALDERDTRLWPQCQHHHTRTRAPAAHLPGPEHVCAACSSSPKRCSLHCHKRHAHNHVCTRAGSHNYIPTAQKALDPCKPPRTAPKPAPRFLPHLTPTTPRASGAARMATMS